jgi:hypothetical protein
VRISVTWLGQQVVGSVCSQAMAHASPVWEKFLFPPWETTSTSKKEKEIDFKEDNAMALLILLNIAHLQFNKIPIQTLKYSLHYDVAILVDQYQCIGLVITFKWTWLGNYGWDSTRPGKEGWLFIAWVFGLEKTFEEVAERLVKGLHSDGGGKWYIGAVLLPETMPPGFIGKFIFPVRFTGMWESAQAHI